MPGVINALPSGDGLDFTAISAAVGVVIFGNSATGLLNSIASGNVGRDLARKADLDYPAPGAHAF